MINRKAYLDGEATHREYCERAGGGSMTTGRPSIRETFLFFAAVVLYLLGVGRMWDALLDRFAGRQCVDYPPAPNGGWGDLDTPEDLRVELAQRARRDKR